MRKKISEYDIEKNQINGVLMRKYSSVYHELDRQSNYNNQLKI